jgi:alkylhydroperoxidase family enzyme
VRHRRPPTARERAALAWTEALTMFSDGVSDEEGSASPAKIVSKFALKIEPTGV